MTWRTGGDALVSIFWGTYLVAFVDLAFDLIAVDGVEGLLEEGIMAGSHVGCTLHHTLHQDTIVVFDVELPFWGRCRCT